MNLEFIRSNAIRKFSQVISCAGDGSVLFSDNKIVFVEEGSSISELNPFFISEWESFTSSEELVVSYQALNLRLNKNDLVLNISLAKSETGVDVVLMDLTKQYIGLQKMLQEKKGSLINEQLLREKNKVLSLEKDLAQLKNDQLKEILKYKDRFLAHMSHELRTPLNALLGFSELLAETDLSAEQSEFIKIVNSSGSHLLFVVNDILDLTKIEAGKLALSFTTVNIHKVIGEMQKTVSSLFKERNNHFEIQISSEVPELIDGDEIRIKQILFNLIENANKFTENGTVKLGVANDKVKGELAFTLIDNGIGINEKDLDFIFNSFDQVFDSSEQNYGGTGLGLTIVKSLLGLMKGQISVKSEIGNGTEFYFSIPYKTSKKRGIAPSKNNGEIIHTGKRILIAEDAVFNQLLVKELLKNYQQELVFVDNGKSALEKLDEGNFDLVLMDIQMPIMDGFETIERIRNSAKDGIRNIPIVAMTAHVLSEELDKIKSSGANDIVLKPLKKDIFIRTLEEQLSKEKKNWKREVLDMISLLEISGGDKEIERSFLKTFIDQTKEVLSQLLEVLDVKNTEEVRKIMHKLANSFNLFRMPMKDKVVELAENRFIDLDLEKASIEKIIEISKNAIAEARSKMN